MKRLLWLILVATAFAQAPWTGILDPKHGIDWTGAGVIGGIPSATWTQCGSTLPSGSSLATINAAIQSCGSNQFVLLAPGAYSLGGAVVMKSRVVLRGAGADQTFLTFTGTNSCGFFGALFCFSGNFQNLATGAGTTHNWTAGYSQGATVITLDSVSGISTGANGGLGTYLLLDQLDDTDSDTGEIWQCENASICTPSGEGASGGQRNNRAQGQYVRVTAINGNNVTISPGLYMPNWNQTNHTSPRTPQASFASDDLNYAGVENLSVQSNVAPYAMFEFFHGSNSWIKGVRSWINGPQSGLRNHVNFIFSDHVSIVDSYFYAAGSHASTSYTFECYLSGDNLIQNNILQAVDAGVVLNGVCEGTVVAYNYGMKADFVAGNNALWGMVWNHAAGSDYSLFEGNVGQAYFGDMYHGNQHFVTNFRNRWLGYQPTKTSQNTPQIYEVGKRYNHSIANVLGHVGTQNTYQSTTNTDANIFTLGWSINTVPTDTVVKSTIMRWGNWDTITSTNTSGTNDSTGTRFCTANATPVAACTEDERGDGAPVYPNLASPSQTFPASFYLTSKPAWWGTVLPYPAIGPDVANGTTYASGGSTSWVVDNVGGHANLIPAQNCFKNIMSGPADGSGAVLSFNASTCYASTSTSVTVNGKISIQGNVVVQ